MGSIEERERIRSRLDAIRGEQDEPVAERDDVGAPWLDEQGERRGADWLPERLRGARLNPGRRSAAMIAAVGVVAAIIAGIAVFRDRPQAQAVPPLPVVHVAQNDSTDPPKTAAVASAADAELVVSVVGLVRSAGLVRLPPGARIADALAAAGGAQDGADLISLNMAQRVADGDQIVVAPPGGAPPPARGPAPAPGAAKPGKVSLNNATEQDLDGLPGVGPVTAAAIVAWRTTNGKFTDIEQLGEVDGIGPGRLAKLRDLVGL
ncbi:ComEA family DNA-binding protein [Antrihabitans cavernicola]|uniref:ComEA family DNA-binding protein n=1 Tax=Antrihabitans cavernicola TaxID=2495913 RepID=A0A5A7SDX2_9NOCA|nr:ComEA family DNA-binding protein [Spelaeibacter cavernicola]KAA0022957.1 ComEA family DNA-binding protein [Spelaeibacter cavernicola]